MPAITGTGTGHSVYYSRSDLATLAAMEYCLSVGLTFEVALRTLQRLREKEPEFTNSVSLGRFMLCRDSFIAIAPTGRV